MAQWTLRIQSQSWKKDQNSGLHDFISEDKVKNYFQVSKAGTIFRHLYKYDTIFIDKQNLVKNPLKKDYEEICRIQYLNNRFFIIDCLKKQEEFLGKLIPTQSQQNGKVGIDLVEGDTIKVGKLQLNIVKIVRKRTVANNYESNNIKQLNNQNLICKITPSDYTTTQNISMVQDNPTCRYCLCKTVTEDNFLYRGGLCKCEGSSKFMHQQCLLQWVKKRMEIFQDKQKRIQFGKLKGLQCEICTQFFPTDEIYRNITQNAYQEYLALKISANSQIIYIIDLTKLQEQPQKVFEMGRNSQCLIIVNQTSVSRRHCRFSFDHSSKRLRLVDLKSKFGTLIKCKKQILNDKQTYQIGRTVLNIKKRQKKSFFSGLCNSRQNLSSAKRF